MPAAEGKCYSSAEIDDKAKFMRENFLNIIKSRSDLPIVLVYFCVNSKISITIPA